MDMFHVIYNGLFLFTGIHHFVTLNPFEAIDQVAHIFAIKTMRSRLVLSLYFFISSNIWNQ